MLSRLTHKDGTEVVLCERHFAEVVDAEEETIGKVEPEQNNEPCCMCEDLIKFEIKQGII